MTISKTFSNGIKVHGFSTGTVAVKKEHFKYSGLGLLRIPKILFGPTFMPDMPIWVWVIETPTGNYLVDTGETTDFFNQDHFKIKSEDYVNRKILQIKTAEHLHIDQQLKTVGLSVDQIDAVLMTHLHVDHTDGIRLFPKQAFIVSQRDWEKPFGVPLSTLPKWFKPQLIQHQTTDLPFAGAHAIAPNLSLLSTQGHTLGHQSVLLEVDGYHILFAGDTTFNEAQLLQNEIGGINLDLKSSRKTLQNIQKLSQLTALIYLPSHDPDSGARLEALQTTRFV